jgi:predicted CoA-binding protein
MSDAIMLTAEDILRRYSTIAVVGASRDSGKAAHQVPAQLEAAGFRIVPVNPHVDGELFGERAYATLAVIPFPVEVVLVFRPAQFTPDIARAAVAIGAKALWLQLGIVSAEARSIALAGGLDYVEDECAAVVRSLARMRK